MKKWTKPEVVDLKISLTAGFYGGVNNAKMPGHGGKPGKPGKLPSFHTPTPKPGLPSFHTAAPTPTGTPIPSYNPSSIMDITDLID